MKELFGVLEDKGDGVLYNLGDKFETFEEAVNYRKKRQFFRKESKLIIVQRITEKGE